jgi:hypothetical protein
MLIDLFEPIRNVVESLLVGAVVHQDDTHSTLVISLSNSPESFLACRVPHLKLDSLIIYIDLLDLEVDSCIEL